MDKIILKISEEYTTTPGVRDEEEGDFSGERFLEILLLPKFQKALEEYKILLVDLDGTEGYATSFLEAAFGGLARHFNDPNKVIEHLEVLSVEDIYLQEDILEYIRKSCDDE